MTGVCILLLSFISFSFCTAETSLQLVGKAGFRGGILFMPQTGDPETAVIPAKDSPLIVYAQASELAFPDGPPGMPSASQLTDRLW